VSRPGALRLVDDFRILIADDYGPAVKSSLESGDYERLERRFVGLFVRPGDRVLELGTAVGVVAMSAAAVVGAENVRTFDANPEIIADAKANFARNGLGGVDARHGLMVNRACYAPGRVVNFGLAREFWASHQTSHMGGGIERIVSAPVFCLEDEIAAFGANVLICDIEGGEVDLLSDADLSGLRLIILDTHYWAQGEEAIDEMVRRLILAGFSPHLLESRHGVLALRRAPTA
jgi:FkbM family methyltransferase